MTWRCLVRPRRAWRRLRGLATAAGQVCWLGHAAVWAQLGAASVLFDPMFFPEPEPARSWRPHTPDWRTISADAIAITHGDHDHLNPGSLLLLNPRLPVFLPQSPPPKPYQVDMEAILTCLGFDQLVPLAPWQEHSFFDLRLTAAPFRGENWGLSLAQCTYLLSGPRGTLYLSADSRHDPQVTARLRQAPPIDLALLGVCGCAEPLIASAQYGCDFYRSALDPAKRNQWTEHSADPLEAAELAQALGAHNAFGYAAGGGAFYQLGFSDNGEASVFAQALSGSTVQAVDLPLGHPVALSALPPFR